MELINYALITFIFFSLVLMVWLWQKLSMATVKLDKEIEALRKWQRDHLPMEKWANFLERSVSSLTLGIVYVDPQLLITYANPLAEQMLGISLPQVKNQPYQASLGILREDGTPLSDDKDPILHIFQTRQPMEKQNYKVMHNNVARALDVTWMPVLNSRNEVLGAMVLLQDVSKQKALEEMKVDFVSIVSHEMRTPITAIKGYIDILLRETRLDAEHAEMLRRVYVSNERQLETVESLLNLSRLERGTIPIKPQPFQIEELVGQVISEVEPQARVKGLEVKFEYPRFALPKVWADPARAREAIVNFCTNAIKYTDEGWVKIDLFTKEDQMWISVSDSGPGIDPDTQTKLFAKFKRGESALTESKQGVGLGLYITKEFVEMMGGKIGMESEVGKGSTFYFTLPLHK
jgi:signal transduction histidine kinase